MPDLHPSDVRNKMFVEKKYFKKGVLDTKHKKFARLLASGQKAVEASRECGWTGKYGIEICRHPLILAYKEKMLAAIEKEFVRKESNVSEAHGIMVKAAPKAANTMVRNLDAADNANAQIRASENILNTAGVMGKEKDRGSVVKIEVGPGFIDMLARNKEVKAIEEAEVVNE